MLRRQDATLVGYHGRRNFGDDIFLRVASQWLKARCDVETIYVAGKSGCVPSELNGARLVAFEKPRYLITRFLWLDIFRHALKSRVLLFSAGSIFTIQPFFLAWMLLKALRLLRGNQLRMVALGVSVGPLRDRVSQIWGPKIFELMDHAVLRDEASAAALAGSGRSTRYTVSYDLALQWPPAWERRTQAPQGTVIGLCLHPGAWHGNSKLGREATLELLVQSVQQLRSSLGSVRVDVFSACDDEVDGDVAIAQSLGERLRVIGVDVQLALYEGYAPEAFAARIQQCAAVVTSRMHVGIIAMMGAVPTLQLAYAVKVADFFTHSGVDTAYLVSPDDITSDMTASFLCQAVAGELQALAETRRLALAARREKVVDAMAYLASVANGEGYRWNPR